MRMFNRKLVQPQSPDTYLTLPSEKRKLSRQRIKLDNGEEAGLELPRGNLLNEGDQISASDGFVVEIRSACESVSTIICSDMQQFARAAFHLGNRHVPLEIGTNWLRYSHDDVLDDMIRGLGLTVDVGEAPFNPESGAYLGHRHSHN